MRFTLLLLALGCAHKPPSAPTPGPEPQWLIMNPSTPALCMPFIGEPEPTVVAAWQTAITQIEAREVEDAQTTLLPQGTHPAHDALHGILAMLSGDAQSAAIQLDALIDPVTPDPCVLAAAATAVGLMGNEPEARARITLARVTAPADPEIALLFAYMTDLESASLAIPALERGAAEQPNRSAFPVALGIASLSSGDNDGAITWFEKALAAGESNVVGMLLQSYRTAGRIDDYLRLASSLGFPLGDDGLLATADSPSTSLYAMWGLGEGQQLIATIDTSAGPLRCTLLPDVAPIAVANFVGLARGTQPWTNPEGEPGQGPLYVDLTFHRVIPEFMVQTGDPMGTGQGGPGYRFPDEVDPRVGFEQAGRLAMANSGPNTNGSQFFITEAPAIHLDGGYTVFGQCDEAAVEAVKAIARSTEPTALERVTISVEGPE